MATSCAIATLVVGASILGLVAGAGGQGRPPRPDHESPPRSDGSPSDRAPATPPAPAPTPLAPVTSARTALMAFDVTPFPYEGTLPDSAVPFFDVTDSAAGLRGHTTARGDVYWEADTYRERRVLLHVPASFDPRQPAVIVVYFHGQGATLERDVVNRQQLPRQVAESGLNAVLVAPQFALDAADSSSGNFWQPGVFARFLDEAAARLAQLAGEPRLAEALRTARVVLVAYSGGYQPAAFALERGGDPRRLRGVILLDALYGHEDKFAQWIATQRASAFFASIFTESTRENQQHLRALLSAAQIPVREDLPDALGPGAVVFTDAGSMDLHAELVTQGWMVDPVKRLLASVPGYRRPAPSDIPD
jgi:hypothetical protein